MNELSAHLFWDVERHTIDPEQHAPWLVRRVLTYGHWTDWLILVNHYGKNHLREIACNLTKLDPRARAFCEAWFSTPATPPCSTPTA